MSRLSIIRVVLVVLCCLLSPMRPLPAQDVPTRHLQGLGELHYYALDSDVLGRGLHLYVRLPVEPVETPAASHPAVYILDGGGLLPLLSGQYHYLALGNEIPQVLLVGISYGAVTFAQGNMRSTDFTAPAQDRDYWGGAGTFQRALADEIIPLVEARYNADPRRRILFGQSLGGQFVLYSALTRPTLFRGHIASNPALHRNLPWFLEWHGEQAIAHTDSAVFVSSGTLDSERFRQPGGQWVEHWQAQAIKPWTLETRNLEGHTHFSAAAEAFTQGVKWLVHSEWGQNRP